MEVYLKPRPALLLLLVILVLLTGCGTNVTVVVSPLSPLLFLDRAGEFARVAALLFADSRPVWGQGIRALYYCALTSARTKDIDGLTADDASIHEKVWQQVSTKARPFFRDTLRRYRNLFDYVVEASTDEQLQGALEEVADAGPTAFRALFDDVVNALNRQFRRCNHSPRTCPHCQQFTASGCVLDATQDRLTRLRDEVQATVEVTVPALVRSRQQASSPGV